MLTNPRISTKPLAILSIEKEPCLYTLAEYLRREAHASTLHEYYDGMITKLPMARAPHNIISANVTAALKNAFKANDKKYLVMNGQQLVYLPTLNFGLYPDVLVVAETPQYWDNNQILLINPILIVEILYRSTKKYDRIEKFSEYKTLDSFQEYVLVDPDRCAVETRFREEPNLWRDNTVTDRAVDLHLRSVNCTIELADIYEHIVFK